MKFQIYPDGTGERSGSLIWKTEPVAPCECWVYGPNQKDITIIGLEPHPEDKKNGAYDKITLSELEPLE